MLSLPLSRGKYLFALLYFRCRICTNPGMFPHLRFAQCLDLTAAYQIRVANSWTRWHRWKACDLNPVAFRRSAKLGRNLYRVETLLTIWWWHSASRNILAFNKIIFRVSSGYSTRKLDATTAISDNGWKAAMLEQFERLHTTINICVLITLLHCRCLRQHR